MRSLTIPTLLLVMSASLLGCSQNDSQIELTVKKLKEQAEVNFGYIEKNNEKIDKTAAQVRNNVANIKQNKAAIAAYGQQLESTRGGSGSGLTPPPPPPQRITHLNNGPLISGPSPTVQQGVHQVELEPNLAEYIRQRFPVSEQNQKEMLAKQDETNRLLKEGFGKICESLHSLDVRLKKLEGPVQPKAER